MDFRSWAAFFWGLLGAEAGCVDVLGVRDFSRGTGEGPL